jgi:hypothetical protein
MKNIILFHASTNEVPPHKQNEKNNPVFHAGTIRAAIDRIHLGQFTDDVLSAEENPQVTAYMHLYECTTIENAHIYDDPSASGYSDYHDPEWDGDNSIDEANIQEVTPYTNRHEDYGSISYAIPKGSLQNDQTKYVGTIPFLARAEAYDEDRIIRELGFDE